MSDQQHRRGQVDWVLWRQFSQGRPRLGKVATPAFRHRIKRLVSADRATGPAPSGVRGARFAFAEAKQGKEGVGQGADTLFSPLDVYCLYVAMQFLDAGFKQTEVITFVRFIRPLLKKAQDGVYAKQPALRIRMDYDADAPRGSRFKAVGAPRTDVRVYLALRRVELIDIMTWDGTAYGAEAFMPGKTASIFEGPELLMAWLEHHLDGGKAFILEIGGPALDLRAYLADVPDIRRGVQSS